MATNKILENCFKKISQQRKSPLIDSTNVEKSHKSCGWNTRCLRHFPFCIGTQWNWKTQFSVFLLQIVFIRQAVVANISSWKIFVAHMPQKCTHVCMIYTLGFFFLDDTEENFGKQKNEVKNLYALLIKDFHSPYGI